MSWQESPQSMGLSSTSLCNFSSTRLGLNTTSERNRGQFEVRGNSKIVIYSDYDSRDGKTRLTGTGEAWRYRGESGNIFLYISLCQLRIYLDQTRSDGEDTNQNSFGDFYLVQCMLTLNGVCLEAIKLALHWFKTEFSLVSDGVQLFCSVW